MPDTTQFISEAKIWLTTNAPIKEGYSLLTQMNPMSFETAAELVTEVVTSAPIRLRVVTGLLIHLREHERQLQFSQLLKLVPDDILARLTDESLAEVASDFKHMKQLREHEQVRIACELVCRKLDAQEKLKQYIQLRPYLDDPEFVVKMIDFVEASDRLDEWSLREFIDGMPNAKSILWTASAKKKTIVLIVDKSAHFNGGIRTRVRRGNVV